MLAQKLQNPKIVKALEEIQKWPFKTIKYVFDKEVMEVFKVGRVPVPACSSWLMGIARLQHAAAWLMGMARLQHAAWHG